MTNTVYLCFSFIGLVLVLIPLPWHLNAWNSGTCLFIFWTALGCLIHFVDGVVWANNVDIHSKIYCDISTKLIVGFSVALPCASLCINRRLFQIATVSQVMSTRAEKLRAVFIDIAIGVGIPILIMALHYIVQGHRFDVIENVGCWPSTVNMLPSYFLVWIWPILIGLVSLIYCCLSLRAFWKRRIEFNQLLAANHKVSANRYFRLMALATTDIICTTPFAIYFMYLNLTNQPLSPWVSWSDTKWHFSRVDTFPAWALALRPDITLTLNLNLWLFPACALLFFAFFGLAEEARRHYTAWFYFVVKPLGITPKPRAPPANAYSVTMKSTSSVHSSLHKSAWDNASVDLPEYSPNTSPVETMAKRPLSIHITVEHATSPPTPISAASTKVSASFPSNFSPASFEFTAIESHHSDIDDMSNVTSAPSVSVVEPKESHP